MVILEGPPRRPIEIVVHVPVSILSVEPGMFRKTFVSGLVARAISIFRVDEIALYRDPGSRSSDLKMLIEILRYMATPPYLRKRVISKSRFLKAVGILPPLATLNHPVEDMVNIDHVREGVVVRVSRKGGDFWVVCVDAGLDRVYCVDYRGREIKVGDRVVVRVRGGVVDSIVSWDYVGDLYWVYRVSAYRSLRSSIDSFGGPLLISTRKGESLSRISERLIDLVDRYGKLSIVFGSPELDPDEIASKEGWSFEDYEYVELNSAPLQGVRSIRTYEALYITLSLINTLLYDSKGI